MLWIAEPEYERRMITQLTNNNVVDGFIVSAVVESSEDTPTVVTADQVVDDEVFGRKEGHAVLPVRQTRRADRIGAGG